MQNNNTVSIQGTVTSNFEFSHEIFGEGFYKFNLLTERTSNATDEVVVMVSERLLNVNTDLTDSKVALKGQIRTNNRHVGNKTTLEVFIFLQDLIELKENDFNNVELVGYICKPPTYRTTPLGREITDFILACNRPYEKSDYVPCIAWGRNARYSNELNVSDCIKVKGRLQSREYTNLKEETHIAYELSIMTMETFMEGK